METTHNFQLSEQQQNKMNTAMTLADQAKSMQVTDPDTHKDASEILVVLQTKIREIEDIRDEIVDPIKEAKSKIEQARKKAVDFFEKVLVPLRTIQSTLDQRMISWRRQERRKAGLEAERKRASELKKIEEQKQKMERVANGLEKKGLMIDAAAIRDQEAARPVSAPIEVAPRIETVKGAHVRIDYVATFNAQRQQLILEELINVHNKSADAEFQLIPAKYWLVNEKTLSALGNKTDGQIQIPGVKWAEDERTVARRRR